MFTNLLGNLLDLTFIQFTKLRLVVCIVVVVVGTCVFDIAFTLALTFVVVVVLIGVVVMLVVRVMGVVVVDACRCSAGRAVEGRGSSEEGGA
jgi:hypothetical protein